MENRANEATARVQRLQNLPAMERLVINMGGRKAYIKWLEAMPEGAEVTATGGMTHQTATEIAGDEYMYNTLVRVFAEVMRPVLAEM